MSDLATRWLNVHNEARCAHGSPALVWNNAVAASAQLWANAGNFAHSQSYNLAPPAGPAGENLAMGHATLESAVSDWYAEVKDCATLPGCSSGRNGKAVGHFTALIWKGATSLGCGIGPGRLYVCRYKAGDTLSSATPNMGGGYTANVLQQSAEPDSCNHPASFDMAHPPSNVVGLILGSLGAAAIITLLILAALLLFVCFPTRRGCGKESDDSSSSSSKSSAPTPPPVDNGAVDSRPLCRRLPPASCWPTALLALLAGAAALASIVLINVGLGDPRLAPFVPGSWTALWLSITAGVALGVACVLTCAISFALLSLKKSLLECGVAAERLSENKPRPGWGKDDDERAGQRECRSCCAGFATCLDAVGTALRTPAAAITAAIASCLVATTLVAALIAVGGFAGDGVHVWEYTLGIVSGYVALALFGSLAIAFVWLSQVPPTFAVGCISGPCGGGGAKPPTAAAISSCRCRCCGSEVGSSWGDGGRGAEVSKGDTWQKTSPARVKKKRAKHNRGSIPVGAQLGDWRAYRDEQSKLKYYYNRATGETSWTPPFV